MKKLAAMVLACLMLAGVLSGCAGTANNEDVEYRWKMALNSTEGDNAYDTGVLFAQKIKDLTNGRVRVDLYGGAQLGTTVEVLEVTKPDGSKESMTADAIIVATGSVNAPHSRPEGEPQLHRLHRRSVSGEAARDHGGHRRRRDRPGAGLRLCSLRHEDHRGGGHGSHAAYAGRRSDQDRRGAHEEDGHGVPSGVPRAVRGGQPRGREGGLQG